MPSNTAVPRIETLPYDVLYEIAHYAFIEDHFDFPRRLSHTSYFLRMFSLATPTLWSHISFTDAQQKPTGFQEQRIWLERSGGAPLHVVIQPKAIERYGSPTNNFAMKALAAIMKLLLPHVGRWRSFRVQRLCSLKAYRAVFDPLVDAYAAELVDLVADIPGNSTRWAFKPFGGGAPKLRCVEVDQPSSLLRGGVWEGWTSLRRFVSNCWVDNPTYIMKPAQILHLIRINPNLEELEVKEEAVFHLARPPATSVHTVEAPNLRHLHICAISSREQADIQLSILLAICAPKLATVEPCLLVSGDHIPVIQSIAILPWPNLRRLAFDGSATSCPQVTSLLSRFSLLEKLDLKRTAAVEPLVRILSAALPSLVELHVYLRFATDVQHVRGIVAARIEDPSLASLSMMHVNAGALAAWDRSPEAEGAYTWKEYQWFREHVKSFYSIPVPREEEPDTICRSPAGRGNWRGRGRGRGRGGRWLPPRRRYRKARQTRRAKKEASRLAMEPDLQPESQTVETQQS